VASETKPPVFQEAKHNGTTREDTKEVIASRKTILPSMHIWKSHQKPWKGKAECMSVDSFSQWQQALWHK